MSAKGKAMRKVLALRPSRPHLRKLFHIAALKTVAEPEWRIPLPLS
jgi:hypothetical protein